MSRSFPDLLIAFEEAVEALKVKLSSDENASTTYNGEEIISIVGDVEARYSALKALFAADGGAALVGTANGITVQEKFNAIVSDLNELKGLGGADLIGTSNGSDVQSELDALTANQQSGVVVFQTYALLDAYTPANSTEEKGSFKVANDPDSSLNGYYSWVSDTTYAKDADLVANAISETNTSDAVSGSAVSAWGSEKNIDIINDKYALGKNLYDFSTRSLGTYLSGSGTLTVNASNDTSDYIAVDELTAYSIKTASRVSVYDADKVWLINYSTSQFTTPSNAAYIKFSAGTASMDEAAQNQVEAGSSKTGFEKYGYYSKSESISDFSDSVEESAEIAGFIKPVPGKNLYNKNSRTTGYYVSQTTGELLANADFAASDYISISPSANYVANYNSFYAFYDKTKEYISGGVNGTSLTSPSNAAFIRISSSKIYMGERDIYKNQFEAGTVSTDYEPYKLALNSERVRTEPSVTVLTASLAGDTDFTGRRAIQDAIDSITDADADNRYEIHVAKGVYTATQASEFDKTDYQPCFIEGKEHVDVIGVAKSDVIVIASLPDDLGANFEYNDYQPVYWGMNDAVLKSMTIIGKNVRYPIHIDKPGLFKNAESNIIDCEIVHYGNTGDALNWMSWNPIGLGTASGQKVTVSSCDVATISAHNGNDFDAPSVTTYKNCNITGRGDSYDRNVVVLSSLGSGQHCKLIVEDCNVSASGVVKITSSNSSEVLSNQKADRTTMHLEMKGNPPLAIDNASVNGWGLRINSLSTGGNSSVRFDENSTAFSSLISTDLHDESYVNAYMRNVVNGYEYCDGGNGLSGYAIGALNIGEDSAITPLGVRLGDCSTTPKTLTIVVDGVSYDVVFNTDLTSESNANVIAAIESVIGGVATVEEYVVALDYYPDFKGNTARTNNDTEEILSGMGVVFTGLGVMRKALNSDNRIDGICLDDCAVGAKGRVITMGQIYAANASQRFGIKEISSAARSAGDELGISATAGIFDVTASPKLLKCVFDDVVEFI